MKRYRVIVDDTSLLLYEDAEFKACDFAQRMSRKLGKVAQVVELYPAYRIVATYENGETRSAMGVCPRLLPV